MSWGEVHQSDLKVFRLIVQELLNIFSKKLEKIRGKQALW